MELEVEAPLHAHGATGCVHLTHTDNGWLTISRFILLDSMLLVFTLCVVLGLVRFHACRGQPFTRVWWFWLFFTGASIGCVTSVKLVGLFATALVGLYTVEDLWNKLGDLRMPVVRIYCLTLCARTCGTGVLGLWHLSSCLSAST